MVIISFALAAPISRIFVGYNATIYEMALFGLRVYSMAFWVIGLWDRRREKMMIDKEQWKWEREPEDILMTSVLQQIITIIHNQG